MSQLKETLSKLTMKRATTLLGPQGKDLIRAGGRYAIDLDLDVTLTDELFLLNIEKSLVTIKASEHAASGLELRCSTCAQPCEHTGAALAVILEEKLALNLAARPSESKPAEELTPEELAARAIADREERAASEKMEMKSMDPQTLWTDYTVTSLVSGKTYRVALRGWERGESYCTCPDFRKNTLGTCKHILFALDQVKGRFSRTIREMPYRPAIATSSCSTVKNWSCVWPLPMVLRNRQQLSCDRWWANPSPMRTICYSASPEQSNWAMRLPSILMPRNIYNAPCSWNASRRRQSKCVKTPRPIPSARLCSRRSSCPISWTASGLPWAPGAPSWLTTWGSGKPFRESGPRNCWPGRRVSHERWWSVPLP